MTYFFKLIFLVIGIYFIAHSVSLPDVSFLEGFIGGIAVAMYLFLDEIDLPPI